MTYTQEALKLFLDSRFELPRFWIAYLDAKHHQIGEREPGDDLKVGAKGITFPPALQTREAVSWIEIYDAPKDGNLIFWWHIEDYAISLELPMPRFS